MLNLLNPKLVPVGCRDPGDTDALTLWGLALCLRGQLASDRGNEEGSGDLRNEADDLFQAGVEKFEAALAVNQDLWTGTTSPAILFLSILLDQSLDESAISRTAFWRPASQACGQGRIWGALEKYWSVESLLDGLKELPFLTFFRHKNGAVGITAQYDVGRIEEDERCRAERHFFSVSTFSIKYYPSEP